MHQPSSQQLAALIRAEIHGSGLDQKTVAGLAGVSVKHISEIVNGHTVPSLDLVDRLLTALGQELVLITRVAA